MEIILHKLLYLKAAIFSENDKTNTLRKVAKYFPTSISGAKKLGFPLLMNEWLKLIV